jgi:hypothetical protein
LESKAVANSVHWQDAEVGVQPDQNIIKQLTLFAVRHTIMGGRSPASLGALPKEDVAALRACTCGSIGISVMQRWTRQR